MCGIIWYTVDFYDFDSEFYEFIRKPQTVTDTDYHIVEGHGDVQ